MGAQLDELRQLLGEVSELDMAANLLEWDSEVYMPAAGVVGRSQGLAALRGRSHELFASERMARLLDPAETEVSGLDADSDDARLVRVTRSDFERKRRVPSELVSQMAEATGRAPSVWRQARELGDFSLFAPYLAANVELVRRFAEAIGYQDRLYDALLFTEPGLATTDLEAIFAQLKDAIVPLVRQLATRSDRVDASFLSGDFDETRQLRLTERLIAAFGYDRDRGRQDLSSHPFTIWMNPGDVRITTRVRRDYLPMSIFGSIHEAGHAMYALGHAPELYRTPLWEGASWGFHESQSRFFENLVGRSRAYWRHWFGAVQAEFPEQLGRVDAEGFYRAVNQVKPSLVRVEADEVTYNLHILLRFEIENALLEGRMRVDEVPAAWNAKMEEYLGVEPRNDSEGALQDIHWSATENYGVFQSYTLGNLIGAQLLEQVRKDLPALDSDVEAGEPGALLAWLGDKIHRHGRKFTPSELLVRVTGHDLSADAWIAYVRQKYGDIYGLDG